MTRQLSMFDLLEPPPIKVEPSAYIPRPRREVLTRAYGSETVLKIDAEAPDPVEVQIRGIPCLIVMDYGLSTYALGVPGSLFWSETGYRSVGTSKASVDQVISMVEDHIDTPKSKMGLGGKLVRWWPGYVNRWQQSEAFHGAADRTKNHWGWCAREVGQDAVWADYDARQAAALARMLADGIDPNDVGPPPGFRGKWPLFEVEQAVEEQRKAG